MEKKLLIPEDTTIEKFHVNLVYLEKREYNKIAEEDKLGKLLYFLICDDKKLNEIYKGDEYMEQVVKEAKEIAGLENIKLYFTEDEILKYDGEIEYNRGVKETQKQMVINMYNNKIPIDVISSCANLTIDEVNDIIKNNK